MRKITSNQRRAIIEATISPLFSFRRGFARDKLGPFFELRTVQGLIDRGILRAVFPVRGRRGMQLTTRAA